MKHPPPDDTTHLYLIRHGATDANDRRPPILQGHGVNGGLSETGRRQAAQVGEFLSGFSVDHVYASPLVRAMETARAIAAHHRLDVEPVAEITEADVGRWEGMDWGTIEREFPDAYRSFHQDPESAGYLGGESYGDVRRRVVPALSRLLERHRGQTVVVVAHNVVNRVYLSGLLGIELGRAKDIRQLNTCINLVRHTREKTNLVTLNAVFHLDALTR